jgi:hypothetical protein
MPDPEAVAEYQAEETRARVQGWSRDALAAARADRGALTPTLRQMQIAFSEQLVNPPPPNEALIASRNQREWADSIQRFGETGSPTVAPEKRDHRLEQRNRLQAAWVSTERPQAELTIPRIRPTRRLR